MNNSTRRGFLSMAAAGAAAAGAVAVGASSRVTNGAAAPAASETDASEEGVAAEGSLVAYVHDLSTGELTFMLDGHEVVVQDRALVAKLAKASTSSRV